jgi:epoxyqueuosine reductase
MLSSFIERAKGLGFIGIGFSRPERPLHFEKFSAWLSENKHADMSWLKRNTELREDPTRLFRGCRTIISLAYPYPPEKPCTPDGLTVSRYCQPAQEDYHHRLKRLCRALESQINEMYGGTRTRICVDSAPILEKSFACSSGIGFMGKNSVLIIPGYGSYLYLAEILTTAPLEFLASEPMENQCGSCSLCIDSCPTGAIERPFCLDAAKCLSYLTVEYKGEVGSESGEKMGDCFFGCDICQEVCPHNEAEGSKHISLPSTDEILKMDEEDFQKRFGRTALARAGLKKIKSNIRVCHSLAP